ncbi:hypothetical protein ACHABX_03120 [Nesterenkonia halotolerans]|uniref:hypothetical protein n=1 Tax=Nesterenkonia halotolerans TaxID=225325 RepID=UPI003EE587AF
MSVAERILWAVAADSTYDPSEDFASEVDSETRHYLTVVRAEIKLNRNELPEMDEISELFDYVLGRIRQLQESVALLRGGPTKDWVARERLPMFLPMRVTGSENAATEEHDESVILFIVNPLSMRSAIPPNPMSKREISTLDAVLQADELGTAFTAYNRLRYETNVLFNRRGDYRMTVLSAAIAAESLLNELLQLLLWDEGMHPEAVAQKFSPDKALVNRVEREFSRQLGGVWSYKKPGPVRDWREMIAEQRNEVAHAGQMPTFTQAKNAVATLSQLEKFLSKRLVERVQERPRTAVIFLGMERVQAEAKLTKKLMRLYSSTEEPPWTTTFARWRRVIELEILRERGKRAAPYADEATLVAIAAVRGTEFYLLDESNSLVCRVTVLPAPLRQRCEEAFRETKFPVSHPERHEVKLVVEHSNLRNQIQTDGQWKYAYKFIPSMGVMANGRNYV